MAHYFNWLYFCHPDVLHRSARLGADADLSDRIHHFADRICFLGGHRPQTQQADEAGAAAKT